MNSSTEYGKRLIPQILDSLASAEPNRIIYSVAAFSDNSHEFRHVSARSFAKAVDKTAWWLHNQVGKSALIRTVGYIGPREWERKGSGLVQLFTDDIQMIFDILF
jgi:hypothetical protein